MMPVVCAMLAVYYKLNEAHGTGESAKVARVGQDCEIVDIAWENPLGARNNPFFQIGGWKNLLNMFFSASRP